MTDDELRPLADALVHVAGVGGQAATATDGAFRLQAVPSGNHTLTVSHAGHRTTSVPVHVPPGQQANVDVRLEPLARTVARNLTEIFHGKYECAWEFLILGGDCLGVYENLTGQSDPLTDDTYAFRWLVEPGWQSLVVELRWTGDASNQFDGMRLFLEAENSSATGHGTKYARADGADNPLRLVLDRGAPHERADSWRGTTTKAVLPDEGERTQIRVFPHGRLYPTTSQVCTEPGRCLLGVGAGVDVRFEVFATAFYHGPSPTGFTAIP